MSEDKNINKFEKHNIKMEGRKKLELTGIKDVVNFNEENIILQTSMGGLSIKGSNMKVNVLNVENGDMCIEGYINSLVYISKDKASKQSILKKMFK